MAHSVTHGDQVCAVRHQLPIAGNAGYCQPQYQSIPSLEPYTQAHSVSTIEEDAQMEEQYIDAVDPDGQYSGHHAEDNDRDHYAEGDYFDDGYIVENPTYEGDINEYGEYILREL